jgi:mitochondrial fission protein ELM1
MNRAAPPRVWLLTGRKAGDNNQVRALAETLQWPFETRKFRYRSWELLTNRLLGVTLAGIDRTASSSLEPPWPDLVITAGRRNEPVARWIRRQSGGHTRVVHLGRPWAPLRCFDLIIATPQYSLPQRTNILTVDLPLHRIKPAVLEASGADWAGRLGHLPRPYWTVLLGGDSGPFVFTPAKARRLGNWVNERVRAEGGSVLVTDSARTPAAAYDAFLGSLQVPRNTYHWGAGGGDNPYLAYLALADRLVVTGESMSMLAEAAATGTPLWLSDLSDCPRDLGGRPEHCRPWWLLGHGYRFKPLSHRLAMWLAPRRMRRDVSRIQTRLIEHGRAVWAGQDWQASARQGQDGDCERAAGRVRALFE